MCAFLIHLSLVIAILIGIWRLVGDQAFMWVVILGGPGSAAVLLFLPKRGPQHAYRNWLRAQVLVMILGGVALLALTFIGLGCLFPPDVSDALLYGGLMVPVVLSAGAIWSWARWMTPTASRSWLRKHYPAVAEAIRRYRQRDDVDEMYTPALVIDGKRLFLIFYHGKKGPDHVRGILLFDEQGRRVADKDVFRRAAKCKGLALETIDYGLHEKRARAIALSEKAVAGVRQVYEILRHAKDRFDEQGPEVRKAWDMLVQSEEVVMAALGTSREVGLLVAEWAATHGLGRLTEVVEADVADLFKRIEQVRRPYVEGFPRWIAAYQAAGVLAEAARKMKGLPRKSLLMQGLLGLADSAKVVKADVVSQEYWYTSDEDRAAWRERMAYADEVDAGQAAGRQP